MATAIGQTGGATGASVTSLQVTLNGVVAGSTIVVGVLQNTGSGTLTVADGQGSYTQCATRNVDTHGNCSIWTFHLKNASAGTHVITATFSPSNAEAYMIAAEVLRASLERPLRGTIANGASEGAGGAIATAATLEAHAGDVILAFGGNQSCNATFTKGATFTGSLQQDQVWMEYRLVTGEVSAFAADGTQVGTCEWTAQGLTIAAPALLVETDDFNRSENPLSTGWGPMDSIADRGRANGTTAVGTKVSGDSYAVRTATYRPNQYAQIVLASVNGSDDGGPMVRGIDSGASGQGYLYDIQATAQGIYKLSGTTFSLMGATVSVSQVVGHTYRVEVRNLDIPTIRALDNGVLQITRTDASSPYASGKPAMFFKNTAKTWDSWESGELIPAQLGRGEFLF